MKKYWFKRKTYGWGWTPATWEGWVVIGVYLFIVFGNFLRVDKASHSVSDTVIGSVAMTLFATLMLILIAFITGESPRWQWGEKATGDRPQATGKSPKKRHTTKKRKSRKH